MNDMIERLLISAVGSLLGFLLGLIAVRLKERRDRVIRIRALCLSVNLVASQLREVLHEDPKLSPWLKTDGLFQFFDLLDEPLAPTAEIKNLIQIYGQWSRGFYLAGGIKALASNATKADLQRIADAAQANFEASPRPTRAVSARRY